MRIVTCLHEGPAKQQLTVTNLLKVLISDALYQNAMVCMRHSTKRSCRLFECHMIIMWRVINETVR